MRVIQKTLIVFMLFWLIAGSGLGIFLFYRHSYAFYFFLPVVLFGAIGVIPSSFGLLCLKLGTWKARMGLLVGYAIVLGLLWQAPIWYRNANEAPEDRGPYLLYQGDPMTTMTVAWIAEKETAGVVRYREQGGQDWQEVRQEESTHFPKVALTGLQPDTRYEYSVPALGDAVYPFVTAPKQQKDFSFALYGDNRPFSGITFHQRVVGAVLRADADYDFRFVINTGDLVENPGAGYGWQWNLFFKQITPLAATRPYLIGLGNHEARRTSDFYDQYFDFGSGTHWYSMDYSGVHFVFLSTQDDISEDSPQYAWLVEDLKKRPADTRFTIAALHKPLITYDPRESYQNTDLRGILAPVFERHGVNAVFVGHVHSYEHHYINGFDHVVSGGGGVLLWLKPTVGPETIKTETVFHFCAIRVEGERMTVKVIRADDSVLDSFEILSKPLPEQGGE